MVQTYTWLDNFSTEDSKRLATLEKSSQGVLRYNIMECKVAA